MEDTFLGEEFAEIELIYNEVLQGTNTADSKESIAQKPEKAEDNMIENATPDTKCDS